MTKNRARITEIDLLLQINIMYKIKKIIKNININISN